MSHIILPHDFIPREYQWPTFNAYFKQGYKRFVDVEHRRAGKDLKWLNIILAASQQRIGTYYHTFPELNQARKAIWKGMDFGGRPFLSYFPKQLIRRVDNASMAMEFNNGSIYQLIGADRYNSSMGTNAIGILFSEYSLQDPRAWSFFEPMLLENKGWASFIFTPRGHNHGYQIYETNKDNDEFYTQFLTVDHTKRHDGTPVITKEQIDQIRRSGTPEEQIQQEYYCSFNVALIGAYYAKEMSKAEEEGRITTFPIERNLPVYTYWDLGVDDATAIWFMQMVNQECRFINYYEIRDEGMPTFVNYLHDFREKHGIVYGEHHAPHDIAVREVGTGKSRKETAFSLGLRFEDALPAPKNPNEKLDHIHIGRMMLQKCWFHVEHCQRGIQCLKEYSKKFDEKTKCFGGPKHDWTSHGADAFRVFATSWRERIRDEQPVYYNRVNQGRL